MNTGRLIILFYTITSCFLHSATCQTTPAAFKTLNVANGVPQSFISGLVQDSTGFIWIATRDGLARYDGIKFKIFRHIPGDTATLADNIISKLYLDKQERLWIYFEAGDVDVFNTSTESLFHLTKDNTYKSLFASVKTDQAFAEDSKGNFWMLSPKGGIYICNLSTRTLKYYSLSALGLTNTKIAAITVNNGHIVLITRDALVTFDENIKLLEIVPYTFPNPHIENLKMSWKSTPSLFRKNGELVIVDKSRVIICNTSTESFITIPLYDHNEPLNFCMTQDSKGQVFFDYEYTVYALSPENKLRVWKPKEENPLYGFKSMLVDQSGVLWMGGNGTGIELFDLRLPRLSGAPYKKNFQEDILLDVLNVPENEIKKTRLFNMESYYLRWTKGTGNDLWLSHAGVKANEQADVYHYKNHHLISPLWRYVDTFHSHTQINGLAVSPSGKLWGIDFFLRPVYFDTLTYLVTVYPAIDSVNINYTFTVSSVLMDGEEKFWISTALNGLFYYNKQKLQTIHYSAGEASGSLPTNQLMNIVQDPNYSNIIWIGSLGGGLIKFDKSIGSCKSYTTKDGLPNNTVYAVTIDAKGILWCSSNKGIFSFNPRTAEIRNFTSKDGLPGDEFNRYHFLQLPDDRIAFGGVDGYTVFNPLDIEDDTFQPTIALTGININNVPADFGFAGSPFKAAINSVPEIKLDYNHNFLTFEFAALEYNITEKLQYRYMLEGVDATWVNARNINIAAYTKIPPGHYLLMINATNTVGKWSKNIKTLRIIIEPPFWQTWWFIALIILAAAAFVYILIRYRVQVIRKEERQKMEFEREASELKAQALRAQMNPHFIFNCLNSIKACIQEDKKEHAIRYLTSFSKLIRSMLNNVEAEIALSEELQTCRLYTQLEALRFSSKIVCEFEVEEDIDLHSILVPPLILQPFIENAIWHGILPKDGGKVTISVIRKNKAIECIIEDNGIGRDMAMRNKSQTTSTYESKGMKLVKNRLNLYNSIHNKGGSIEVIDKKDKNDNPEGTIVIVKFKEDEQ